MVKRENLTIALLIGFVLIILFFIFKPSSGDGITGNIVLQDSGVVEFKTSLQEFKYVPDTIEVKEGSIVRLIIDNKDNVNHGLHLPQFGIVEGIPPMNIKTVEFKAIETATNGQAVPTCSQEHGETLTIKVV